MRALVTGASSGIGAAIAVALASDGHEVIAAARRRERLEDLAERHSGITPIALDVTDAKAAARVITEHDPIELLVNNAGAALGLAPAHEKKKKKKLN
jgi:3-hydroxy acid dehydrogenase/malonic semialdehyde reductase